jgi:hypothetical protein
MAFRNVFFVIVLGVLSASLFAAGGRDQNVSRTAEDPSGFTDTIDTSNSKPGKYNFYLEARDRAGNITLAGPENIIIDPASDLPSVTIINPINFMRVQGNLNIVGLAFDDDGVQKVELVVTRGIDGRGEEIVRVQAEGTDYWSYFLSTADTDIWTDGNYTITAWATDINGLSGIAEEFANGTRVNPRSHKRAVVYWTLDRKKPETIVTSHEVGALVSGNIRLRGSVSDGNGISSFSYSLDGGERYINARTNLDRRTGEHSWEININTRQFEDGPAVIWFRGQDGAGSIGTAAHLLFINNTGPDVQIVYPDPAEPVSGIFSIAGYASHTVGLRRVTWRAGNIANGEFELLPGNHWWSTDIDLRGQRINSVDIEIRAEDVSGNVTTARQRYRVDNVRDLPIITLTEPTPGILNNELGLVVKGTATDNSGVTSIFYSLNGGEAVEIPCHGYFQFRIPSVPEGSNNFEIWAKDINGVIGPRVTVRGIIVPPALPAIGITSFSSGTGNAQIVNQFFTGMTVTPIPILNPRTGVVTGFQRINMNLFLRGSAQPPVSSSIQIGESSPVPLRFSGSGGSLNAVFAFPDNLADGLTKIQLRSTDRFGREVVFDEYIYVNNQQPEIVRESIENEDGTFSEIERRIVHPVPFNFHWARSNALSDGRFLFDSSEQVLTGISSVPLRSVTVTGTGANNVNAEIDEHGRVSLRVLNEGDIGPLVLRVQDDDTFHQLPPIRLHASFSEPVITLQGIIENTWVRTAVPLRFNVTGRTRITAVEYSLDMGDTWISFGTVAADYNRTLDITGAQDGSLNIMIRAANEAGRYAIANFTVLKDTIAPQARLIMPIAEARVNGTIRMAFEIEELGTLNTISYNRPARTGVPAITREIFNADNFLAAGEKDYSPRFIEVLMDSIQMPLDASMRFVFTDKAGNSSEVAFWDFIIDQEMDIPVVHIILPLENEVITSDFIVSGVMFDDDGIKNLQYRINTGPWQTVEAVNGFSIPVSLASLTDGQHSVTVIAEDIYGVRSAPVSRAFRVSLSEPAAAITFPLHDTVLRGPIEIRGTAFDRNGIKEVLVSLDNGNTFNTVRGTFGTAAETIQWTYQFNSRILKDGAHVVFIRVIDNFDIPATYANMINIDNTPPVVNLDSPGDGSVTTGSISVMGRILDPNLSDISIQLRGLDGQQIAAPLRSRSVEPASILRETINLAGQADGHYNIAVIATDRAGNITRVSRNFELARTTLRNYIEILYPLENEEVSGEFNLYGFAGGADKAENVILRVGGRDVATVDVDDTGFFRFALNNETFVTGNNSITVHSNFGTTANVTSRPYNIKYNTYGPWVTIDSFTFGDFAYDRPFIYGRTGYVLSEEDINLLSERGTDRETRANILAKTVDYTEISFDNGRTFRRTNRGTGRDMDYRYRLETGDMPEGMHYIVVRSTMRNGEIAITRMLVQVDKTPPVIRLISPEMGGVYNKSVPFSASATDDVELVSLRYHLRIGDKAMYAVPGFLQGLYFESTIPPFLKQAAPDLLPTALAGGHTYMDIGIGLSFFEDNVKIQFQYGFMTTDLFQSLGGNLMRYGGNVFGLKLLASIYHLPFITILGPDFEWLSATFALGANFSLFEEAQSGSATWLSALLLQIEFPRVTLAKRKNFRTFSFFTEGQLWFIPTDLAVVNTRTMSASVITGLRLYIF